MFTKLITRTLASSEHILTSNFKFRFFQIKMFKWKIWSLKGRKKLCEYYSKDKVDNVKYKLKEIK